jgi:hypothetical protein
MQKYVNADFNDDFHFRPQYGFEMADYRSSEIAPIVAPIEVMVFRQVVR